MYQKKIKFEDFNGNVKEKTYLFHLTKAELMEMELSVNGGLQEYVKRIVEAEKTPQLVELFKKLILMSYGEKSDDGMRFVKKAADGHRLSDDFEQTDAYSELFMELATNAESATAFVNGILPAQLQEQVAEAQKNGNAFPPSVAAGK